MKRALILYWHGLGDVIMLTPHLRWLYRRGYVTDLMCRPEVRISSLLDACPYVGKLFEVPNPWQSRLGFKAQAQLNIAQFQSMRDNYDWSGASPHYLHKTVRGIHKIDMTSQELDIDLEDKRLEVFISPAASAVADSIDGGNYIFVHRICEWHPHHTWDPEPWILANFPPFERVYTDENGKPIVYSDINEAFVIAKRARHRIIASSVFLPACIAMDCTLDAVNFGSPDRKVWPLDQTKVLHIQESGRWIK